MDRVHLDHNATTPLREEARAEFVRQLDALGGNPSSVHAEGRAARAVLDDARERVAAALGVHEDEIVFTGGGTEAIHLGMRGVLAGGTLALVTSAVEHAASLGAAAQLETAGHRVEYVGVDAEGRIAVEELCTCALAGGVGLVALMAANNEVGTVYPIAEIGARLRSGAPHGPRPLVFTDAVQALGRIPVAPRAWAVDLAAFSAHKVGGPLGVGVLYRRSGVTLQPLASGGGQEFGLRPGTENVPAIAAAAVAIELAVREQSASAARWRELTRELWQQLHAKVPDVRINGPSIAADDRLPNTLNVHLPGFEARMLVARLDLEGLAASAGSACASGSLEPSHVLLAMGRARDDARAGVRLSLGRTTNSRDIHSAVEIVGRTLRSSR